MGYQLVESNGMEPFPKYFRRLLSGNSPQIFPGIIRNVENAANYPMLVQEVENILKDPSQASRIADAIDTAEGDIFRDFDLSTFMEHFKMNPFSKTLLASALGSASRLDLRNKGTLPQCNSFLGLMLTSKAATILKSNFQDLQKALANSENTQNDVNPTILATCVLRFLHDLPAGSINQQDFEKIMQCLQFRYKSIESDLPSEIKSLFFVMELDHTEHDLYLDVLKAGPSVTASSDAAKRFLTNYDQSILDGKQMSGVLLFMIITPDWQPYDVTTFAIAIQELLGRQLDWYRILREFDRSTLQISKSQFLAIIKLLRTATRGDPNFDIQTLWRGPYVSEYYHISILAAFFACTAEELDVASIPQFRRAYDPTDLHGESEDLPTASIAKDDPTISLDAVAALLGLLSFAADPTPEQLEEQQQEAGLIVAQKIGFFICSACAIEKSSSQPTLIRLLLKTFYLMKRSPHPDYVLRTVWRLDKHIMAATLVTTHGSDPLLLPELLTMAHELGWLDELLTLTTAFGFDLAALAHRNGLHDFIEWAEARSGDANPNFAQDLHRFLIVKAQNELQVSRGVHAKPYMVNLSMQTAYDMLTFLDKHLPNPAELKVLQRTCFQAYPRLILLCESVTEGLDVDCRKSNAMPPSADVEMQELYKQLYEKKMEVQRVIECLRECKESNEPARRDLFACMIHGLFDEYSCFSEYPLDPLQKTALLFGGIIKVGLISDLTLRVAREMVLDALQDYNQQAAMFKFGHQALTTFAERLHEPEWSDYCSHILQISTLNGTQARTLALNALTQNGVDSELEPSNGTDGVLSGPDMTVFDPSRMTTFKSLNPDPEPVSVEPDERTQENVVFFFNNVSPQNLVNKFGQLRLAVREDHHVWFADFLVNSRAKVEPNYHSLYLDILRHFNSRSLSSEVLRSTYSTIEKLLNSEAILGSSSERKSLKSLAVWLGSLTLAQDKPIKRRQISFLDLLREGYQYDKLILVIPFVCNVLAQGRRSTVFKPPNPWIMELLAALVEFYHQIGISTNQKFDIEVLFDEFGVDLKSVEPSTILSRSPLDMEEPTNLMLPDGIRNYDNLALGALSAHVQNPKFEVEAMHLELPDLEPMLKFPPANGSTASQVRLRQVVVDAVTHAIYEIIGSVVERSVTVATIATSSLINKDFACEEDEDRVRQAAHRQARELASSLAQVTSKDPLRQSMSQYLRRTQAESPEQAFPEGTMLMCVNDNVDFACQIVEDKAADQSLPEIEAHIEREIASRVQWRSEHANEPYVGPTHTRWSTVISEPYKQTPGGLKPEQVAIYADFGRQPRGPTNHAQTPSADSGRQVPDVLQDAYSSMPHMPAAADNMTLSHQMLQAQQYQQQRGRMLPPPPLPASITQAQTNGFVDLDLIQERVQDMIRDIRDIVIDREGQAFEALRHETSLFEMVDHVKEISSSYDSVALKCAEAVCQIFFDEVRMNRNLAEILAHILSYLYQTFPATAKEIAQWADSQNGFKLLNTDATIELLKQEILQLRKVDESIADLINQRVGEAVEAFSIIAEELLLSSRPLLLRADFARSLAALAMWSSQDSHLPSRTDIWRKLTTVEDGVEASSDERTMIRKYQVDYVFNEWIRICEQNYGNPDDNIFAAFVVQVQMKDLLRKQEDVAVFLRLCLDAAIAGFQMSQDEDRISQRQPKEQSNKQFLEVDWLAKLIVYLVKSDGEQDGIGKKSQLQYMDSILSLITLIMNHHQVTQAERFNQRVFFRLLSGIMCDWYESDRESGIVSERMLLVFAANFLTMGPRNFPGFIYGWLGLIAHRFFLPGLLKIPGDEVSSEHTGRGSSANTSKGFDIFAQIMEQALSYVSRLLTPQRISPLALDLYRGLLRIMLVLHHDFPEFLAEAHFTLCNAIPPHATQLLNLTLSAAPLSFRDLPSPFVSGLKFDRLEEIRRSPRISPDFLAILHDTKLQRVMDAALTPGNLSQDQVMQIVALLSIKEGDNVKVDTQLMHAIIIYIGTVAINTQGHRGTSAFVSDSPPAILLQRLFNESSASTRFHLIGAIVNQLRWPNAHTQFFAYATLHLFGTEGANVEGWDQRQQIFAVLLERLHVVLPHPWGLVVVMLEILKNPAYGFWHLPFVKNSPQVCEVTSTG